MLTPTAVACPPTVTVEQGRLQGIQRHGVAEFLGIPYAAPPTGPLRWRPPQPASPWPGTLQATEPGPRCPQTRTPLAPPDTSTEDCLFLNVYKPATHAANLPVMVWIHGGYFLQGSGGDYDAGALAGKGKAIVVTINYRLGALGSLALPSLSEEAPDHASGQYGLMDQQAALRWVRANITAFGGNPRNVTLFGESTGGISVCDHVASPTAAGLFHRAIAQSNCNIDQPDQDTAKKTGTRLARMLGCHDPDTAADCLRRRPVARILRATYALYSPVGWHPATGGKALPTSVLHAFSTGRYNRVPVIHGTNHDEGNYFIALENKGELSPENYRRLIVKHFGHEVAAQVEARYPLSDHPRPRTLRALGAALTDAAFACPAHEANTALARRTPTYAYEFSDPSPVAYDPDAGPGTGHAAEIPYVFRVPADAWKQASADQRALSDTMIAYWTRFAATGDPNTPGAPPWPRYDLMQELRPGNIAPISATAFARDHQCRFWLPLRHSGQVRIFF
ncbi:carboxylesterase/lipase family protein [Streptomyces sp. F63]|uniref:carboxylesterase/lipase family protein n=1 Tax=Streptomyces sp. F63 TaxID=2824887 RepID=UPI0027DE15D3|nr:carboxylesterase/lipase family protein [Streptomyces sp. F63]